LIDQAVRRAELHRRDDVTDKTSQSEQRTDLAENRTNFAEDRTILANERTFAGWMRTGLAAVGIGLAFNAVFPKIEPWWVARAIASAFIVVGIMIFFLAERKASSVVERMNSHETEPVNTMNMRVITGLMSIASASLLGAIWLMM
jgi:putative membrane protein